MKFKTTSTAALLTAAVVASSGFFTAVAPTASAVGLGGSSSSTAKKSTPKKKSTAKKKATSKKKSTKASTPAKRAAIVKTARKNLHVQYRSGGTSTRGWDCSGFTKYVYGKNGVKLPRTSSAQGKVGKRVSAKNAKAGDLIWVKGHVGIVSNKKGKMFDAGNSRVDTSERSYSWMVKRGAKFIRVVD